MNTIRPFYENILFCCEFDAFKASDTIFLNILHPLYICVRDGSQITSLQGEVRWKIINQIFLLPSQNPNDILLNSVDYNSMVGWSPIIPVLIS